MVSFLIGLHAALGEIGSILFLWVFVELLNPNQQTINRAKKAALIGFLFLVLSWLIGGYYYVNIYGSEVKPLIKESTQSYAHLIVMETKEHAFLILPILSCIIFCILKNDSKEILKNKKYKKSVLILSLITFLIGMSMAFMGYIISTAARFALEVKLL